MKRVFCVCAALAMMLTTATALAADVTGKWTGETKTPVGNSFQLTFIFKLDDANLTGNVQGPQGDPIEISNGKVDGDKFIFHVSFNGLTIHHDCTLNGDEIKTTTKSDSPDFSWDGIDVEACKGRSAGGACIELATHNPATQDLSRFPRDPVLRPVGLIPR
jgi:hypothetical protein